MLKKELSLRFRCSVKELAFSLWFRDGRSEIVLAGRIACMAVGKWAAALLSIGSAVEHWRCSLAATIGVAYERHTSMQDVLRIASSPFCSDSGTGEVSLLQTFLLSVTLWRVFCGA